MVETFGTGKIARRRDRRARRRALRPAPGRVPPRPRPAPPDLPEDRRLRPLRPRRPRLHLGADRPRRRPARRGRAPSRARRSRPRSLLGGIAEALIVPGAGTRSTALLLSRSSPRRKSPAAVEVGQIPPADPTTGCARRARYSMGSGCHRLGAVSTRVTPGRRASSRSLAPPRTTTATPGSGRLLAVDAPRAGSSAPDRPQRSEWRSRPRVVDEFARPERGRGRGAAGTATRSMSLGCRIRRCARRGASRGARDRARAVARPTTVARSGQHSAQRRGDAGAGR